MNESIWKHFIEPYLLFGNRWIFLLSFAAIGSWYLFVKKYKEISFKNSIDIKNRLFWLPSLVIFILAATAYFVLLYYPLPNDRFVIAIADFYPVSPDEIVESKKIKDRLIREIQGRQKQYNTKLSVEPLDYTIDCSTDKGIEIAKNL